MHYCTRIRCDEFLRKRDIEKYFVRRDDPTLSISPSENIGGGVEDEIDNSALLTEKAALNNFVEKAAIMDLIYPVGSVYVSLDNTFDPNTAWKGTTWEKVKEGIFLEATEVAGDVGTEKKAGLPNITGTFATGGYNNSWNTGAFAQQLYAGELVATSQYGVYRIEVVRNLDASRSSAVYGKSNTVQPHSVKAFVWKRTA